MVSSMIMFESSVGLLSDMVSCNIDDNGTAKIVTASLHRYIETDLLQQQFSYSSTQVLTMQKQTEKILKLNIFSFTDYSIIEIVV